METTNDFEEYIDVLEREFLMCDVAGGQFGKAPEFTKGNPHI